MRIIFFKGMHCAKCKTIAIKDNWKVVNTDTAEGFELARKCGVRALPTLITINNGDVTIITDIDDIRGY